MSNELELKIVQNTSYEELRTFLSSTNSCRTQDVSESFSAAFEKRVQETISHGSKKHLLILLDVANVLLSQNQVPVVKKLITTNFMRSFELIMDYLPNELSSKNVSRPQGDQVLVKFLDFILRIVDNTKVLYLWFTQKMLHPLFKIVATPTAYFKVRHECLIPLAEILSTVSRDVNAAVRHFVTQEDLNFRRMSSDLMKNLANIGDYRLQESILELLFRIWSTTSRNEMALVWSNNNSNLADILRKISYNNFDYDSRQFLNAVNSASSRRKVLSLPYKELQVGHQVLHLTSAEFTWVDFCYESKVLSILFPLEQTECIIPASQLFCFDAYENVQKNTIDLHLTFHKTVSQLLIGFDQLHGNVSSNLIIRLLKDASRSRHDVLLFTTALFGPLQQSYLESGKRSKPIENFSLQRTASHLDTTHTSLSQNSCQKPSSSQASSSCSIIESSQRSGQVPAKPVLSLTQRTRVAMPTRGPIALPARPPSSFYSSSTKYEYHSEASGVERDCEFRTSEMDKKTKMMMNSANNAAKSRPIVPCLFSQTKTAAVGNRQYLKYSSSLPNVTQQPSEMPGVKLNAGTNSLRELSQNVVSASILHKNDCETDSVRNASKNQQSKEIIHPLPSFHTKSASHPKPKEESKSMKNRNLEGPFLSQASASSDAFFKKCKPGKGVSAKKSRSRKQQQSLSGITKDQAHAIELEEEGMNRTRKEVDSSSVTEISAQKLKQCEIITEVIPETQNEGYDNKDVNCVEVSHAINELLYDVPRRITRALSQIIEQGNNAESNVTANKICLQNEDDMAIEASGPTEVDRVARKKKEKRAAKVKAQLECLRRDLQDKENDESVGKKSGMHPRKKARVTTACKRLPKKKRSLINTDVYEPLENLTVNDPKPKTLKQRTYTREKSYPAEITKLKHFYGVTNIENEEEEITDIPSPISSPEQLRFEEPQVDLTNYHFGIRELLSPSELYKVTFDDVVLSLKPIEACDETKNEAASNKAFGDDHDIITSQLTHIPSLQMPKFTEFDISIPKELESDMSQISELAWQNNRTPTDHGMGEILDEIEKKPKKRKIVEESLRGQNSKKKNKDMKDQVTVKLEDGGSPRNIKKDEFEIHKHVFTLVNQYAQHYNEVSNENCSKRNEEIRDFTRKINLRSKFHSRTMQELDGYLEETEKFVELQTRKIDNLLKISAKSLMQSKEEDNSFQLRLRSTNDDTARNMRKLSRLVSEELRNLVDSSDW